MALAKLLLGAAALVGAYAATRKKETFHAEISAREGETPHFDLDIPAQPTAGKKPGETKPAKPTTSAGLPGGDKISRAPVDKPARTIPAQLQAEIAEAIRDESWNDLKLLAAKLDNLGFSEEAENLRKFAAVNAANQKVSSAVKDEVKKVLDKAAEVAPPPPAPPEPEDEPEPLSPIADEPEPEPVYQAAPPADDPVFSLAREVTDHLQTHPRYKEDRKLVKAYQEEAGLSADGMYGAGSATDILSRGILPVVPYYWSSKGPTVVAKQKADFRAAVLASGLLPAEKKTSYMLAIDRS